MSEIEQNSNFSAKEIQRLKKRFMKLDRDGSGSIDKDEFLQIPAIANNPLALRLIAIFDEDGGGTVDFQEFVAGLSAFSNQGSREEKLRCKLQALPLCTCHVLCIFFSFLTPYHPHTYSQSHSKCTTWTETASFPTASSSSSLK